MSSPTVPTNLDITALLDAATLPTVPEGVAKYCAQQLGYFSASNRNRRTITMSEPMAPWILANRPDLLDSLDGVELATAVAKEFSRQVKEYAEGHGLSCYPKRSGCTVTFRFTKPSESDSESDDA